MKRINAKERVSILIIIMLVITFLVPGLLTATEAIDDQYFRYLEPITITTAKEQVSTSWLNPDDSQMENRTTRKLMEKFNIDVQTEWISDEYYTKLALGIAGNDIPDAFVIDNANYSLYLELVENDMLMDMSEVYEEYASDYVKDLMASYDNRPLQAITDSDGAMYGIPSGNFYYDRDRYLWVRQDWLDTLDMSQPSNMDELESMLIAFRDNFGSKGLLFGENTFSGTYNGLSSLAAAYGVQLGAWISSEDGSAVYGSLDPKVKDLLTILQRWYSDGLIHPEFMTLDASSNSALFSTGESGAIYGPWWSASGFTGLLSVEDAKLGVLSSPLDSSGKWNILMPADINSILCVSKDAEHPEAIMQVINYVSDKFGEYDEIYTKYNEEGTQFAAYYPFGGFNLVASDEVIGTYYGIVEYLETGELSKEYELDWLIKLVDKYLKGEPTDAEESSLFWYTYGYYYASELMAQDNVNPVYQAFSGRTPSMGDFWQNLQTLESTVLQSIIIGEKPVEAYDEFIEQWKAEGGNIITEEVNELINK